jgi:hypothetical protein
MGNGGNDNFIVGDGNLNLDYTAQLEEAAAIDQITYDNHLDNHRPQL